MVQDPVAAVFNKLELNSSALHTLIDEEGDLPVIRVRRASHNEFRAPSIKLSCNADRVAVRA